MAEWHSAHHTSDTLALVVEQYVVRSKDPIATIEEMRSLLLARGPVFDIVRRNMTEMMMQMVRSGGMLRRYRELALVKEQTSYMRLAGVTEDVLEANPAAVYWVADFGHGWSRGHELYCYFCPKKFGGQRGDGELAWFVRGQQEKPSPQFDDHDHFYEKETYNWVSVPRKDLGWRVALASTSREIEAQRTQEPGEYGEFYVWDPYRNMNYPYASPATCFPIYDETQRYMYEDAESVGAVSEEDSDSEPDQKRSRLVM